MTVRDGTRAFAVDVLLLRFNPLFTAAVNSASLPSSWRMTGPMMTSTVPGYFKNESFGQNSPAVEGNGDNVHFKQLRHPRRATFVTSLAAGATRVPSGKW